MTPSPFTTYAKTVCALLHHATQREKEAVQQELEDHLTDHAEALVEAGWDEAHATQHALDAMGDPQEVGQELSKAFPFRWLLLSRLAFWALVLAAAIALWSFVPALAGLPDRLQAQFAPDLTTFYQFPIQHFTPLEEKQVFSGGTVLSVYGMGIQPFEGEGVEGYYTVSLASVFYHQNPFRTPAASYGRFWFTAKGKTEELSIDAYIDNSAYGTCYFVYTLTIPPTDRTLTFHYSFLGTDYTYDFTPPWEEVLP